jgi:hypothetical protein
LLLRASEGGQGLVEFYANDLMSHPFTIDKPASGLLSAVSLVQLGSAGVKAPFAFAPAEVKAWRMTLPAF